jgi:phosphoserine aminotransferase
VSNERIFNFSAGPATLPEFVLQKAQSELLNYRGVGYSVMEMSHRSKEFKDIIERAEAGVRKNLGVPEDYAVLFLQGGATQQFAMIPMNLYLEGKPVDMIHTGSWTKKAMGELKVVGQMNMAASTEDVKFTRVPRPDELKLNPEASYVYCCSNNTIAGTQYKKFPDPQNAPLVSDMSSDILSRKLNVSDFGLIFAGAQKNLGPAGVTLVIIKKELAERVSDKVPKIFQYKSHIEAGSLYNTAPTFPIYIVGLVMDWIANEGGLEAIEKRNIEKARLLYDTIDGTDYYSCPVEPESRSAMNVVYRIKAGDEDLEQKFIAEATAAGLSGLKGHRSVGGLRASIYNAMPVAGVKALVDFMKDFEKKNG